MILSDAAGAHVPASEETLLACAPRVRLVPDAAEGVPGQIIVGRVREVDEELQRPHDPCASKTQEEVFLPVGRGLFHERESSKGG